MSLMCVRCRGTGVDLCGPELDIVEVLRGGGKFYEMDDIIKGLCDSKGGAPPVAEIMVSLSKLVSLGLAQRVTLHLSDLTTGQHIDEWGAWRVGRRA